MAVGRHAAVLWRRFFYAALPFRFVKTQSVVVLRAIGSQDINDYRVSGACFDVLKGLI